MDGVLFVTLPRHCVANRWAVAWGGFDIGLGSALAGTAVMVFRRSPYAEMTAAITGTLLVCDAWFDVLTSRGVSDVAQALRWHWSSSPARGVVLLDGAQRCARR